MVGECYNDKRCCNYPVSCFFLFSFFQILLGIRVKKAQAPYTFVCVPVIVHLQNADFVCLVLFVLAFLIYSGYIVHLAIGA